MGYVGIQTQQSRNNVKSVLMLLMFPVLILLLVFAFFVIIGAEYEGDKYLYAYYNLLDAAPIVILVIGTWFLIAYFTNTAIISTATNSQPLERKENKRIYSLVENLSMSQGMKMPKVNVIEDSSLNAFASGINDRTYTVTLTRGIIEHLNDEELEGVIAHELMHIRNRDVRVLIVSIVFVGIFTIIANVAMRMTMHNAMYGGSRRKKENNGNAIIIIVMILSLIGYFFSTLLRFSISRKREYMADAGAAQITKNPQALASALRKISGDRKSVV